MDETRNCPECGSPVSGSGPADGLCPRCLMKRGLSDQAATRTAGGAGRFEPPEPEELAGRFPNLEIIELIGHGGMGAVYRARQTGLDRMVALKILAPDRVQDPAFAERFGREARTLARLSDPHIVGIHDFGEAGPSTGSGATLYYLVMEYVDGASLRELMQAGRLSPAEALALVPQICKALQYAHDSGVVHRDIKPENILLDRSGTVKIADFGLAKLLEPDGAEGVSLTATGATMGTPAYMAPEQIEHPLEVDHRADIYAVGVVFYEMLTGELPLGRFDPPSSKVRVDVRLDRVVLRALEKERTRRYQLAREVTADLDSLGRGQTPAEPPAEHPVRRTVTIKRPPFVTWIATYCFFVAALLVLLVMGGAVFFLMGQTTGFDGIFGAESPLARLLPVTLLAGLAGILAVWHVVAGFGALRLRSWARYHLIVLASIDIPFSLLAIMSFVFLVFLPTALYSVLMLLYLFKPAVARMFELGPGPVTLPAPEADAVAKVMTRPFD
jgi:tRNA A-37 threonylcarbamoyl transferase component Bud32